MDKTYLCTGLPTVSHHGSLTTHALRFIGQGAQAFAGSSLQTDSLDVEKNTILDLNASALNVYDTATNEAEVFAGNSKLTAAHWDNSSTGVPVAVASSIEFSEFNNQGAAHLVASEFTTKNWQEHGKFAADGSKITRDKAHFTKESQLGFRATDVDLKHTDTEVTVGLDLKGTYYGPDHQFHQASSRSHLKHNDLKPSSDAFKYADEYKPEVCLTPSGGVLYQLEDLLALQGRQVSVLPLAVKAPQITVYKSDITSAFSLSGDVSFNQHSHLTASGSVDVNGGQLVINGGTIESGGALTVQGEHTIIGGGATFVANGDVKVISDGELTSTGHEKTTISKEHKTKWFGLVEKDKTEKQSTFKSNSIISINGNVDLESGKGINLKATNVSGSEVTFTSGDKMSLTPLMGENSTVKTHTNPIEKDTYEQGNETASPCNVTAKKSITFTPGADFENL